MSDPKQVSVSTGLQKTDSTVAVSGLGCVNAGLLPWLDACEETEEEDDR